MFSSFDFISFEICLRLAEEVHSSVKLVFFWGNCFIFKSVTFKEANNLYKFSFTVVAVNDDMVGNDWCWILRVTLGWRYKYLKNNHRPISKTQPEYNIRNLISAEWKGYDLLLINPIVVQTSGCVFVNLRGLMGFQRHLVKTASRIDLSIRYGARQPLTDPSPATEPITE